MRILIWRSWRRFLLYQLNVFRRKKEKHRRWWFESDVLILFPIYHKEKHVTSESLYYICLSYPLFYYYLIKVVMYLRLDLAVKINVSDQNSKSPYVSSIFFSSLFSTYFTVLFWQRTKDQKLHYFLFQVRSGVNKTAKYCWKNAD